jgi:pimeloyl-ACP methyl ester carboxylesterase
VYRQGNTASTLSKAQTMKKLLILFAVCTGLYLTLAQAQNLINSGEAGDKEIVVLIHGYARSNASMWLLNLRLQRAGYHVKPVGYSSLNQSPGQIIDYISRQIDDCCRKTENPVHFVGHSLGGLLIRAYLSKNNIKQLGRVVMIGTPNQGTEVADYLQNKWWGVIAGPTALALGTGKNSFPNTLPEPDYPVGVIAGVSASANDDILPGLDDGLVPVESTRLSGMQDFVIVYSGHSMMRYNDEVAAQTIEFLKTGTFDKTNRDANNDP